MFFFFSTTLNRLVNNITFVFVRAFIHNTHLHFTTVETRDRAYRRAFIPRHLYGRINVYTPPPALLTVPTPCLPSTLSPPPSPLTPRSSSASRSRCGEPVWRREDYSEQKETFARRWRRRGNNKWTSLTSRRRTPRSRVKQCPRLVCGAPLCERDGWQLGRGDNDCASRAISRFRAMRVRATHADRQPPARGARCRTRLSSNPPAAVPRQPVGRRRRRSRLLPILRVRARSRRNADDGRYRESCITVGFSWRTSESGRDGKELLGHERFSNTGRGHTKR